VGNHEVFLFLKPRLGVDFEIVNKNASAGSKAKGKVVPHHEDVSGEWKCSSTYS
jgi:hypothetical protein